MRLTKNKIIGAALIGIAALSTINIDLDLDPVETPYPAPEQALMIAVEPLIEEFKAGEADIEGLFDAIGLEVLANDRLVKVANLKALNRIVSTRLLGLVNFKVSPGVGSRLDALLLEVEDDPEAELTQELREEFAGVVEGEILRPVRPVRRVVLLGLERGAASDAQTDPLRVVDLHLVAGPSGAGAQYNGQPHRSGH